MKSFSAGIPSIETATPNGLHPAQIIDIHERRPVSCPF
jgi:hypothetical protein